MTDKTKIHDLPVQFNEGMLVVVAEILRHERKQQKRDYQEAGSVIREALQRLGALRVS